MKRILLLILTLALLCGCSGIPKGDECALLTQADWEGNNPNCINWIRFREDGSFSNSCGCGSPVGDGDLTEQFRYHAADQTVELFDGDGALIETGKILYLDEAYLVIDLWDSVYTYENLDAYRLIPRENALQYTGTGELTKPYLTILDFKDGVLTVTSMDYDGDAADMFELWELPAAEDIKFSTVSVTVVNDTEETIETGELTEADYPDIGEYHNGGYFEFNEQGEVTSVVVYGELLIYE